MEQCPYKKKKRHQRNHSLHHVGRSKKAAVCKPRRETSPETELAETLLGLKDFQPSELRENECLLLKLPSLWHLLWQSKLIHYFSTFTFLPNTTNIQHIGVLFCTLQIYSIHCLLPFTADSQGRVHLSILFTVSTNLQSGTYQVINKHLLNA